jgi:hypothetical protein
MTGATRDGVREEFLRMAAERARQARAQAVDAVITAERVIEATGDVRETAERLREAARRLRADRQSSEIAFQDERRVDSGRA